MRNLLTMLMTFCMLSLNSLAFAQDQNVEDVSQPEEDTTLNESPFIDKSYLLECYRKELIGQDAAKEIMYAINLNLRNIHIAKSQYNQLHQLLIFFFFFYFI